MNASRFPTEMLSVLEKSGATALRLCQCLAEEQMALGGSDADLLAQVTATKTALLGELEVIEQQRRTLCRQLGSGDDRAAMESLMARLEAPNGSLHRQWQALSDTLRECQQANQANGLIVSAMQRRVRQTLGLLRGTDPDNATYGPGGAAQYSATARAIARA